MQQLQAKIPVLFSDTPLTKAQSPVYKKQSMPEVKANKSMTKLKRQSIDATATPQTKVPSQRTHVHLPTNIQQQAPRTFVHSPLEQESTLIKVYARFRPPSRVEVEMTRNGMGSECVVFPDGYTVVLQPEQTVFTMDQTFGLESTQESVYRRVGSSTIQDVLNGYNGTIFAYGQTGSGKTYTMFGDLRDNDLKGIIPRSIEEIFDFINNDNSVEFILSCSMLEIYKETLYDLLSIARPDLKIKECPQKGIYVENLTQLSLSSQSELLRIVELGEQTRRVAATRINQYSSRSHTIFMLEVRQKYANDTEKRGKLNLVDLAGSEKVGKTGAMGEILEEAKKINLSLSCLGNVIHAITTGNEHIPYRNSKVTRVLQESLGGNYKTSLIVTCSSHSSSLEETVSTLKFASRTKSIRNHFKVNMKVPYEVQQQIIMHLKQELVNVRQEMALIRSTRSILDIPSEDNEAMQSMQEKYNSTLLSNQQKQCFKKHSLTIDQNISNIIPQQSTTIDLSFFSQKKTSSADLQNELNAYKDREIALTRQLDQSREQQQSLKLELHKQSLKLQFLTTKLTHYENRDKENAPLKCIKNDVADSKQQTEYISLILNENKYLNKQLELLNSQFEQDRYFQGLLREKIESMNLDYFNKIDHLLNEEMSQSRVLKIINRQRGQTEDIVKKLSRNNFVNIVYRIVSRELQEILKHFNPEQVKKSLGQVHESMMGAQLDSALIDLIAQYETSKIRGCEDRQRRELLVHENKRLNDRMLVLEEQVQQITMKNEKILELMSQKNQMHRDRLQALGENKLTRSNRNNLFRFDYGE